MTSPLTKILKDSMGRYRTRTLFQELNVRESSLPSIFTLAETDDPDTGAISFKRKYVEICDPTEYRVAQELFGSWDHWVRLSNCNWFKPILEELRNEVKQKIRSEMFQRLVDTARSTSPRAYDATRHVHDSLKDKPGSTRGRPSKAEIAKATRTLTEEADSVDSDFDRLLNIPDEE